MKEKKKEKNGRKWLWIDKKYDKKATENSASLRMNSGKLLSNVLLISDRSP